MHNNKTVSRLRLSPHTRLTEVPERRLNRSNYQSPYWSESSETSAVSLVTSGVNGRADNSGLTVFWGGPSGRGAPLSAHVHCVDEIRWNSMLKSRWGEQSRKGPARRFMSWRCVSNAGTSWAVWQQDHSCIILCYLLASFFCLIIVVFIKRIWTENENFTHWTLKQLKAK